MNMSAKITARLKNRWCTVNLLTSNNDKKGTQGAPVQLKQKTVLWVNMGIGARHWRYNQAARATLRAARKLRINTVDGRGSSVGPAVWLLGLQHLWNRLLRKLRLERPHSHRHWWLGLHMAHRWLLWQLGPLSRERSRLSWQLGAARWESQLTGLQLAFSPTDMVFRSGHLEMRSTIPHYYPTKLSLLGPWLVVTFCHETVLWHVE